jgi:phosphate starvation-inducible membrane PsiE
MEIDLSELETLIGLVKLLIVILLSYFLSSWIRGLIAASGLSAPYAIIGQIISFFLLLYVFYRIVGQFTQPASRSPSNPTAIDK